MPALTVDIINDLSELANIEPHWNALLSQSHGDPVFGSYAWYRTWWEVFLGKEDLPVLFVVRKKDELLGVTGFYLAQDKMGIINTRNLKPIGIPLADYFDFLVREKNRHQVVEKIIDHQMRQPGWDVLILRHIKQDSPLINLLINLAGKHNDIVVIEDGIPCPLIRLEDSFETFQQKRINTKNRKKYRWQMKKLAALGEIKFEMILDRAEISKNLPYLVELENKSWKGAQGVGIFSSSQKKEFFSRISDRLAEQGKVALHLLWHNSRLISYNYCFLAGDTLYFYNTAFDPDYGRYSPGTLAFLDLIKWCHDMKIKTIDMLRGQYGYKTLWCDRVTENVNLHLFSRSLKGRILAGLFKQRLLLRGIKRKIQQKR